MQDDMVFVSYGAERNEEILALTAAVLLPTVSSVFGPGIVRDSKGRIITVESAGVLAGRYTWIANASGEGGNDMPLHVISLALLVYWPATTPADSTVMMRPLESLTIPGPNSE